MKYLAILLLSLCITGCFQDEVDSDTENKLYQEIERIDKKLQDYENNLKESLSTEASIRDHLNKKLDKLMEAISNFEKKLSDNEISLVKLRNEILVMENQLSQQAKEKVAGNRRVETLEAIVKRLNRKHKTTRSIQKQKTFPYQLLAISLWNGSYIATMKNNLGDMFVLEQGEFVSGWKVTSVTSDKVKFSFNGKEKVLEI